MIDWPPTLIEELAARRVVLFLGAGVSASSKNSAGDSPPNWKRLLELAKDSFLRDATEKGFAEDLLRKDLLLDAAEVIFAGVGAPERRSFFNSHFAIPQFKPSAFHKAIRDIDAKVVLTTNYDQIYEEQCDALRAGRGYTVRAYHDHQVLNDIRSKDNLIIKAHGCISKTEKIILTRSDYFSIKRDHAYFYHILNSLLTINTVLFIGCGMSDPDILLALENMNIAAYSDHPHYAVIPNDRHQALVRAMEKSYNIKILQYPTTPGDNHKELLDSLEDLQARTNALRGRAPV